MIPVSVFSPKRGWSQIQLNIRNLRDQNRDLAQVWTLSVMESSMQVVLLLKRPALRNIEVPAIKLTVFPLSGSNLSNQR